MITTESGLIDQNAFLDTVEQEIVHRDQWGLLLKRQTALKIPISLSDVLEFTGENNYARVQSH